MVWRDIPSLAALRAFEAAARVGSFSAAARELNVTHAAIAQHVRATETQLGTRLLVREGRGMALTETGAQLAEALTGGFQQIIDGVIAISEDAEKRPLRLSVTPSFAENWLMPRMTQFWKAHPGFSLSITPDAEVVDLLGGTFDMGIRYGRGHWDGLLATHLTAADFTVVASPDLVAGRDVKGFDDLYDLPWLFETTHRESRKWVEDSGLDFACCQAIELATFNMVLSAARSGGGVCVVASALIQDDIAKGRLVALMKTQRPGLGYYIVHRENDVSKRVKILKSWLQSVR